MSDIESADITFENIGNLPPTSEMVSKSDNDSGGDPNEDRRSSDGPNLPEDDKDHEPIAKDKEEPKDSKPKKESKPKTEPKKSEEKPDDSGESDNPVNLKFNNQDWNLKELVESPEKLGELSKAIEDGFLRRDDYTKKTQALASERQAFQDEVQQTQQTIQNYLEQTDQKFVQNPRLYVEDFFRYDENGNIRKPEEVQRYMNDWVGKLASEIKLKDNYNPTQLNKQYNLENKVLELEKKLSGKEQEDAARAEANEIDRYKGLVKDKIDASLPTEGPIAAFIEKLPGFREMMAGQMQKAMTEELQETYNEEDPTWDNESFVKNYKFNKVVEPIVKIMNELHEADYQSYIEKKAGQKAPTAPKGKGGSKGSEDKNEDWTFEKLNKIYG